MKNIERVVIDWNSLDSIRKGEAKKARLENAGYNLIASLPGLIINVLVYRRA